MKTARRSPSPRTAPAREREEQHHRVVLATEADAEDYLGSAKNQYIYCRTWGHRDMRDYIARPVRMEDNPAVSYEVIQRCKCRVKRVMLLDSRARVVRVNYDYTEAPGYLVEGVGRMVGEAKDRLRLHLILPRIQGAAGSAA